MSRFNDWGRAQSGICQWLGKQGFELDIRNVKGKKDRYIGIEIRKIVRKYTRFKKLKCSHSSAVLYTSDNFQDFKEFINNGDYSYYKTPPPQTGV